MAEIASTDVVRPISTTQYRSLQALRALAALMVVLHHIGGPDGFEGKIGGDPRVFDWAYLIGPSGVDLFFVISGFIMTVTTAQLTRGVRSARSFLLRRVCRIYPAYLVVTAAIFLVYLWRPDLVNSSQATRPDILASFLLLPQEGLPLLLVGWTLVYELYFYLVFAATLLAPRRISFPLLGTWGVVVLVLHQLVTPDSSPFLRVAGNLQNLEFLLGIGAALLVTGRRKPSAGLLLLAGAGLLGASYLMAARAGHLPDDWTRIVGIGGGCALLLCGVVVLELRGRFRTPTRSSPSATPRTPSTWSTCRSSRWPLSSPRPCCRQRWPSTCSPSPWPCCCAWSAAGSTTSSSSDRCTGSSSGVASAPPCRSAGQGRHNGRLPRARRCASGQMCRRLPAAAHP
jgi:exopolysaccharide production protein ExoZ